MIWVAAVVLGLSVLTVFTGVGLMVRGLQETQCDATAFAKIRPGLLTGGGAVLSGACLSYALTLLTQGTP